MNNYFIIKKYQKDNKLIFILKSIDGKYYLKKQLINRFDNDMLLSLRNEILCFNVLKESNIIPKIVDFDLNSNMPYLIMEYLNLTRLDFFVFLSLKEKIICMINILNAVGILHNYKIIHCDLKPQNIFVDKNFGIKIIDFGISSINGERNLVNYGSLNYCSPEQIKRQTINNQADIFSLGIIFYKLITGDEPFKRERSNMTKEIKDYNIKEIQDEKLNNIFLKSIDEQLDLRYQTVDEFKNDLINFLNKKEKM